jgi:hypothetical protein
VRRKQRSSPPAETRDSTVSGRSERPRAPLFDPAQRDWPSRTASEPAAAFAHKQNRAMAVGKCARIDRETRGGFSARVHHGCRCGRSASSGAAVRAGLDLSGTITVDPGGPLAFHSRERCGRRTSTTARVACADGAASREKRSLHPHDASPRPRGAVDLARRRERAAQRAAEADRWSERNPDSLPRVPFHVTIADDCGCGCDQCGRQTPCGQAYLRADATDQALCVTCARSELMRWADQRRAEAAAARRLAGQLPWMRRGTHALSAA